MQVMKRLSLIFLAVFMTTSALAQERPRIVAVNHALQSMAERIAGDTADVLFLVPEGVDPSFWRPSISDISTIQSADLILLNGAGFATWIDRVSLPRARIVNTSSAIAERFITTESITHSHGDGGEHSHEGLASYLWLDPELAAEQATAIANAMINRDLAPEAEVQDRLDAIHAELSELDSELRDTLADAQDIVFVATHPRYQYFAQAYELEIVSLEWEAGATPDDSQMSALSALTQKQGAKILIWEAEPTSAAKEAVASMELESVTFPPLAMPNGDKTYLETMRAAAASLAAAAMKSDME